MNDISPNISSGRLIIVAYRLPFKVVRRDDDSLFMAWILSGAGLRKSLFDEMVSHQVERKAKSYMGFGWVVYEPVAGDQYAISHGGHDPGVHTIAIILPKSNKALLIFTNSDNGIQLYPQLIVYYLKDAGRDIVTIETGKAP